MLAFSFFSSALSILAEVLFLRQRQKGNHLSALILKALASLLFCLTGLVLSRGKGSLICAGLFCGLLGDVLLGLRKLWPKHHDLAFTLGALSFCLGHGFYMAFLIKADDRLWIPGIPVFLVLLALSILFSHAGGFARGKMHLPGMVYIGVEAMMCALALVLAFKKTEYLSFALGGVSFLVSDNLLCAYSFGRLKAPVWDWALHGTYLAAQLLIAWTQVFI